MSMGKGKQTTRHSSIASRDGAKAKEGTKMAEPGEKAQKETVTATHEAGDEEHVEMAGLLELLSKVYLPKQCTKQVIGYRV